MSRSSLTVLVRSAPPLLAAGLPADDRIVIASTIDRQRSAAIRQEAARNCRLYEKLHREGTRQKTRCDGHWNIPNAGSEVLLSVSVVRAATTEGRWWGKRLRIDFPECRRNNGPVLPKLP